MGVRYLPLSSMTPSRSASPSVAMPMSKPYSMTFVCRGRRVSSLGAGILPPKRVSWVSWMDSTSQRVVMRRVLRGISETPYMGSMATLRRAFLIACVSSFSSTASRYSFRG